MSTKLFDINDLQAAYEDGWTGRHDARFRSIDGGNPPDQWANSKTFQRAMGMLVQAQETAEAPSSSATTIATMTVPLEIPVDHPAIMLASAIARVVHTFRNSTYPLNQSEIESAFELAATIAIDKEN